jgi:hypothetical protein
VDFRSIGREATRASCRSAGGERTLVELADERRPGP